MQIATFLLRADKKYAPVMNPLFSGADMDYRTIAPLCAYIDRIGAQQLNFRRFMVREYHGVYYEEKCIIKLAPDGTITCSEERFAPTDEERTAIKAAFVGLSLPQYVAAEYPFLRSLRLMIAEQRQCEATALTLFEFFNRQNDKLVMIQERVTQRDGGKKYIPWTYWSDGVWRAMEPDEELPLWKPRHSTHKAKIMVHEGAKAAWFIHNLINNPEQRVAREVHPWSDELSEYEHWGMIGGALAPHRTNWNSLRVERPLEVVYVCDNDFNGKEAIKEISRTLRYSLKSIMFDDHFDISFDLADPLPAKLFDDNGNWFGQTLKAYMRPATWATELKADKENPKKVRTYIRREFAEEWVHSITPEAYIHKHFPSEIMTAKEFNNYVQPYTTHPDVAQLLKSNAANKTVVLKYSPELKSGTYSQSDQRFINTHKPSSIKGVAGDATPFMEFMNHLCPSELDRIELLRWCATLIARPDIKMLYGVLLISEYQGVGKGTLGEKILAPLVGLHNTSFPNETEIVDSNYNYWASHKRLAIVHEIYAGHSAKAYNKLKSIITDHHITVSQKYMANYLIDNWVHVFACSNSPRALKLSMDDRRWFVPKITNQKRDQEFWETLNRWLVYRGGLKIIRQWAEDWLTTHAPVMRGADAPWSTRKQEIVEEGYSEGQRWVEGFLQQCKERMNGHPVLMTDQALREGIKTFVHEGRDSQYLESTHTIRKLAKAGGWYVGQDYLRFPELRTNYARTKLIASTESLANLTNAQELEGVEPLDVLAKAREWQRI